MQSGMTGEFDPQEPETDRLSDRRAGGFGVPAGQRMTQIDISL